VTPFVLAPATLRLEPILRDRAAQLAGPGSVLAGPSAARSWEIPVADRRIFLVVPPGTRPRFDGAHLLHDRIDPYEVWIRDGAAVTSRPRTVVDCLRVMRERGALNLLERSLQERWISPEDLTERVRDLVGHHGIPKLVRFVRTVSDGTRSAAERRATRLLSRAGIHGWVANAAIRDDRGLIGVGDVVFEETRVVIELDGWAFHAAPDRLQRDRDRQKRLVSAGWTVLRFTWRDLTERPEYVTATVTPNLRSGRQVGSS
jgi:hypothetical protein